LLNGTEDDVAAEAPTLEGGASNSDEVGAMVLGGAAFVAMEEGQWARATQEQAEQQLARVG
jgi:hypothetical protein